MVFFFGIIINNKKKGEYLMKISKKILGLFMLLFATVLLASCGEADLPPEFSGMTSHSMAVFDEFDPMAGVTATDAEDGDLTSAITYEGAVDNLVAGTYTITYTVTDSAGNVVTASRSVTVNPPAPENYPLAQYHEGVNLSLLDGVEKDKLFAAAESYMLENVYAGVPLYRSASRVMFSSRTQLYSEEYNGVLGFGTAYSQFSEDDSTVEMLQGVMGNPGEYTWRSSFSTNPTTFNPWLADDSVSSDFIDTFTGGFYEFFFDASKTGYEILPSFAKSAPVAVGGETINGKEYSTVWQIPIRDDLTWKFHPNIDTTGFASGFEKLDASDWLWTWQLAMDSQWFRAISGGGDFITKGIKGAAEYINGTGDWENVGLKVVDGNTIQLEYLSQQSEFDVVYGFTGASMAALNQELYESLGDTPKEREEAYGRDELTVAANGTYYIDVYTPFQLITVKKNMDYVDKDLYFYTGQQFRFIEGSEQLFEEFLAGRLESASVPASRVEEFLADPRVKTSPGATTWRLMMNLFGSEENRDQYLVDNPSVGLDPEFVPEPLLGYLEFRQALYYGFDRYKAAVEVVKTYLPAHTLFAPTYFLDGSSGLSVRTGAAGAEVVSRFGGESNGYFPDAALDLFKQAVAKGIEDGHYTAGTAEEYTEIELSLTYASSGNTAAQAMIAELVQQYETLLVDNEKFVRIKIVVADVEFPFNYYDYMMKAATDLGIGGISGSLLDAPGFLDVFADDNRGGFNLNWGKDSTTANIPVSYKSLSGEVVYETWGYNALVEALNGKTYIRDGQEQTQWMTAEGAMAARLDGAGEEYESSVDGQAVAELALGETLEKLAEDEGYDALRAFIATTASEKTYLVVVSETFGEFAPYYLMRYFSSADAVIKEQLGSEELASTADGRSVAEIVLGDTLENKATEAEVDSLTAYIATTASGNTYLVVVSEKGGLIYESFYSALFYSSAQAVLDAQVGANEEVVSSVDGQTVAEAVLGDTLANVAAEAEVDSLSAYILTVKAGENETSYLVLVAETGGVLYELYSKTQLYTDPESAIVAHNPSYTMNEFNETPLTLAELNALAGVADYYSSYATLEALFAELGVPAGATGYVYATQWETWPTEAYAVYEIGGFYFGVAWLYTAKVNVQCVIKEFY
jgi:ABC-type oligopeptide transport system substrate-binding subunit